jgi:hypothetical protein
LSSYTEEKQEKEWRHLHMFLERGEDVMQFWSAELETVREDTETNVLNVWKIILT